MELSLAIGSRRESLEISLVREGKLEIWISSKADIFKSVMFFDGWIDFWKLDMADRINTLML